MKLSEICDAFLDGQLAGNYKIKSMLIADTYEDDKTLFVDLQIILKNPLEYIKVTYKII